MTETSKGAWLCKDAPNPIAELDQDGNIRATFIYGSRAHVPDAMVMADGTVYRLITDHLGSVRLVVNAQTGEVVQRIDYDAFGRVLQDTNPRRTSSQTKASWDLAIKGRKPFEIE